MSTSTLAASTTVAPAPAGPGGLISRPLLVRFVSVVGSSVGFYLPLSVMPLYAAQSGSASGAGLSTVALLLATVACELVTPRLAAAIGYRWALAAGLLLLGAPTLILTVSANPWTILGVSLLRGAGFGMSVVAGGAVTVALIPADRRGQGLALVGLVGGVPGMLALPFGVWAAATWGYTPVFVATATVTLLALLSVPAIPTRLSHGPATAHGVLATLRDPALNRPAAVFVSSTAAVGVLVTFLPLATTELPAWVAAAALLAQPAASTASRWFAGRFGDLRGHHALLTPGVLLAIAGMCGLAGTGVPAVVVGGALVFGLGFGVLQNATLALMYNRATPGGEGAVSAVWNAAYDVGMAAGALAAGFAVTPIGYPATFALTAAAMIPALAVVRRDRTRS